MIRSTLYVQLSKPAILYIIWSSLYDTVNPARTRTTYVVTL